MGRYESKINTSASEGAQLYGFCFACYTKCSGSCSGTCSGSCSGSCKGSCMGNCKGGCYKSYAPGPII